MYDQDNNAGLIMIAWLHVGLDLVHLNYNALCTLIIFTERVINEALVYMACIIMPYRY